MRISKLKVYDLEESIIASGYPMMTELLSVDQRCSNLKYWLSYDNFLTDFIRYQKDYDKMVGKNNTGSCLVCGDNTGVQRFGVDSNYYCGKHSHHMHRYGEIWDRQPKYTLIGDYVEIELKGDYPKTTIIKISTQDLPKFFYGQWAFHKYCSSNKDGLFHRFIFEDLADNDVVDHINGDTTDNRRCNLRICSCQQNSINSKVSSNNSSGFTGVCFKKDKNKWKAYIFINGKQKHLGYFSDKEDAIRARLIAESIIFKEFAPQRNLFAEYGIDEQTENCSEEISLSLQQAINDIKRIISLGNTEKGSGHDQALSGIRIAFDLTFSNKAWVEAERYRFLEFVSSQSTMHRITKLDIRKCCNKYVWESTIKNIEEKVAQYNVLDNKGSEEAKELYLEILYNIPAGFELTARLTTNYRSIKTIYDQRKNHRLPEWREFCKYMKDNLPLFKEIVLNER